jgi:hypothetical protein
VVGQVEPPPPTTSMSSSLRSRGRLATLKKVRWLNQHRSPCLRMSGHDVTHLARPELVAYAPLDSDVVLRTIRIHISALPCLEYVDPVHARQVTHISNVRISSSSKILRQLRTKAGEHLADIGNGGCTQCRRRYHAHEVNLPGEGVCHREGPD